MEFTCTTPPSRVIDFGVASQQVLDLLVSFGAESASPFRPRVGLVPRLRATARSVCKRALVKPTDIPQPECPGVVENDPELWLGAQGKASRKLDGAQTGILGRPGIRLPESQEDSFWGAASMDLGRKWANSCLTSEMFTLAKAGIDPGDFGPCFGRGQFLVFRTKPVVPRTRPERQASSKEVEFWSVLAARLRELPILRQRGTGLTQQAHLAQCIVMHIEAGASTLSDRDEWRQRVADLWMVGHLDIMLLVRDANKPPVAAQRAATVEISRSVANWLCEALRNGAGPAH